MRDSTAPVDAAALRNIMEAMRFEVARELGYSGVEEGQCGHWTSAQSGRFGATLYKRAKAVLAADQSAVVPKNGRNQSAINVPKNQRSPNNRRGGMPHAKS